ncbi:MAG TPA: hypothetical protein VM141_06025 [Planctomycetota bacterium]|nr:hypothetical protein [Planctomycetota bacterium]
MRGQGIMGNLLLIVSVAIFVGGLFGDIFWFSVQPSIHKCFAFTLVPGSSVIFGGTMAGSVSPLRMLVFGTGVVLATMSVWFAWCAYVRGLAARDQQQ